MKEFTHRTDLLNAEMVCFVLRLREKEFQRMLRAGKFPEPEFVRTVETGIGSYGRPRKVVYWRKSTVRQFERNRREG